METINKYLNEIISFKYTAELGSFTKAAEATKNSKGQISKDVQRLETFLGVKLLERTTRRVILTKEGDSLLEYANKIVSAGEEASLAIKQIKEDEGGLIRLTAPGSMGNWLVPGFTSLLHQTYPNLQLELDLTVEKRDLVKDKLDFALRAMVINDPDLVARPIGHIKDVIVCSKRFLRENKHTLQGVSPTELESISCVLNTHNKKWNSWSFKKGKKDINIKVSGKFASSSYNTTRLLCLDGMGVARLPLMEVHKELESGDLIQLYPKFHIATHPLYLVYPHSRYRTKVQKQFRDLILDWLKDQKDFYFS